MFLNRHVLLFLIIEFHSDVENAILISIKTLVHNQPPNIIQEDDNLYINNADDS